MNIISNMRICIDLDGVICQIKNKPENDYSTLQPVVGAAQKVQALKNAGHYIIIYTARRMKTHKGNLGKVVSEIGYLTIDWLNRHQIPYDEIYFGKPWADIYIDDNAMRFTNWFEIEDNGKNLPNSIESTTI